MVGSFRLAELLQDLSVLYLSDIVNVIVVLITGLCLLNVLFIFTNKGARTLLEEQRHQRWPSIHC